MTEKEKCELLKDTIYTLYSKEGRSKSYISKLLLIDRKTLINKIKEWDLPASKPAKRITPSVQKFISRNEAHIISLLNQDVTMSEIARELGCNSQFLRRTVACSSEKIAKAFEESKQRKNDTAKERVKKLTEESSFQYINIEENDENWKHILGYENYLVSKNGEIACYAKKYNSYYLVKAFPNKNTNRLYVMLYKDGKKNNYQLARIVANAFCEKPNAEANTVNHKDGNILNNSAQNLEWVTQSENLKHSYDVLNRKPNKKNHIDFIIKYKNKYEFKTVASFSRFLNISETQVRRYLETPEKYNIEIIHK